MPNVSVICVGGLKEDFWKAACAEYCKRLGAWVRVNMIELPETRLPEHPSPAQIASSLEADGAKLLLRLPKNAFLCALCIEGVKLDSPGFAGAVESAMASGGEFAFAIGGSNGLSQAVKDRAQLKLSFSDMTFPHMLARVMLLEQLYRALGILHGSKYHK